MYNYDVVTIGSATRDALVKSKELAVRKNRAKRGLEESIVLPLGTKIRIEKMFFGTGGAGTNTAVTFARQKFRVAAVANVGNDPGGRAVIEELKKEHVDARFVRLDLKEHTAYSVVLEPISGERVILTYRGANEALRGEIIPFSKFRAPWVYLSSLSGDLSILKRAIRLKKKYATRLAWNPGGGDLALGLRKLRPFLKYMDVFLVNQEEAARLLGIPYRSVEKVFKKFDEIIDGIAVMTRGPKGVIVSDGKTMWRAGIFKEKAVVDRTGAGDSFGSGFVAGLIRKTRKKQFTDDGILYALRLGSANATSKVEYVGAKTGLLTKHEFESQKRWKHLPFSIEKIRI
ncbi:MAG: carbohydrate kinase family protein [Candidatus Niyogibacteria bacterium]|nr:carbohydrate kinase family protein [Candidatus Niyogibacteria bacterium]